MDSENDWTHYYLNVANTTQTCSFQLQRETYHLPFSALLIQWLAHMEQSGRCYYCRRMPVLMYNDPCCIDY
jgi:hypothetical protein